MSQEKSQYSRRKFLSTSATCLVSAGLASVPMGRSLVQGQTTEGKDTKKEIIYRQLGKTNFKTPIVGMGVMNADAPEIVRASYELGVRHFDTAAFYQFGRNEQMVGNVIKELGVRDKVAITTKVLANPQRRGLEASQYVDKIITLTNGSLKRLNTDYVDMLHIHGVSDAETVNHPEIIKALTKLKESGKIRFVGVSTHQNMALIINEAVKAGIYEVVLTSFNVTMAENQEMLDAVKNAADNGVGIVAMKTQVAGGQFRDPETLSKYSSATLATACLKWVMRNENITTSIPGYDNFEHMRQDFSVASDLEYSTEEENLLKDNSIKLSFGFCQQCSKCLASCPEDVDVPNLMRTHMYATRYGNFHQARATLNEIPRRNSLINCVSCSDCTARCANAINIPKRIDELKLIYT